MGAISFVFGGFLAGFWRLGLVGQSTSTGFSMVFYRYVLYKFFPEY